LNSKCRINCFWGRHSSPQRFASAVEAETFKSWRECPKRERSRITAWSLVRPWISAIPLLLSAVDLSAQAPANDQFSNRIALVGTNITVTASNTNATKQGGEPDHAGNIGGKSVWWTWTVPTNGDLAIRTDGSTQVTYAGHPLYYYVGDTKAGQILCQGVTEFGGTWWVVNPDGTARS